MTQVRVNEVEWYGEPDLVLLLNVRSDPKSSEVNVLWIMPIIHQEIPVLLFLLSHWNLYCKYLMRTSRGQMSKLYDDLYMFLYYFHYVGLGTSITLVVQPSGMATVIQYKKGPTKFTAIKKCIINYEIWSPSWNSGLLCVLTLYYTDFIRKIKVSQIGDPHPKGSCGGSQGYSTSDLTSVLSSELSSRRAVTVDWALSSQASVPPAAVYHASLASVLLSSELGSWKAVTAD